MVKILRYDSNSPEIKYLCKKDKRIAKVVDMVGSLDYRLYEDPYIFLVKTIIGQMLSNKVADVLNERLRLLCPDGISPSTIFNLGYDDLHSIGISKQKTNYIMLLTDSILNDQIDFPNINNLTDKQAIKELTSLSGIGNWSAKMYLIFVLNRMNVLPFEDGAFLQSYMWLYKTQDTSPESITKKCKKWSPYSSLAARYLYRALDCGYTKKPFHLHK